MGGYLRAMKSYATFEGRASRAEFWQFVFALMLLGFVALLIDGAAAQEMNQANQKEPGGIVTALVLLAHLIPSFAVTARRLHDTNRTGWLVLLNVIPPVNLVIAILACLQGTVGPNRFGPDPLAVAGGREGAATDPKALSSRPSATPAPPTAATRHDIIAELERLGRLRKDGHLSEAEFEVMKVEALAQARGT